MNDQSIDELTIKPNNTKRGLQQFSCMILRGKPVKKDELKDYLSNERTDFQYLELNKIEDGLINYSELKYLKPGFEEYLNDRFSKKGYSVQKTPGAAIALSKSTPFKVAYFANVQPCCC